MINQTSTARPCLRHLPSQTLSGYARVTMLRRSITLALIPPLMLTSGCSFTFTDTVPDNPTKLKYFDCTNTPGLAVADGVIAVSNGVSGVMTLTQDKDEFSDENDGASRDLVGGIALGIAAVMVASGIYGIVHSENCRRAKNELESRLLTPAPEVKQRSLAPETPATPPPAAPAPPPAAPAEPPPPSGQAGEIKMLDIPPEQTAPPAQAP
jgi:hypothetical protein